MMIAAIKIQQKAAGLGDEEYRLLLKRVTGKLSSKELSDDERRAVLDALRQIAAQRAKPVKSPMERKLWAVWYDFNQALPARQRNVNYLCGIVRKAAGRDDIQHPADFANLTDHQLYKSIEALKLKAAQTDPAPF